MQAMPRGSAIRSLPNPGHEAPARRKRDGPRGLAIHGFFSTVPCVWFIRLIAKSRSFPLARGQELQRNVERRTVFAIHDANKPRLAVPPRHAGDLAGLASWKH